MVGGGVSEVGENVTLIVECFGLRKAVSGVCI